MFSTIYLSALEISQLLANYSMPSGHCPNRFFSFSDTTIVQDDLTILAVFTADMTFAETIRHIKIKPEIVGDVFTPPCRCNIIDYKTVKDSIPLLELNIRYGIKV